MSETVAEFWCYYAIELQEIFERFSSAFIVNDYIHDAENIWEWFDGCTADGKIGFNISRQWDEESIPNEPIRLSLTIRDESFTIDEIGRRLAAAFDTDIHTGSVKYLRGDDFQFTVDRTFKPPS